MNLRKWAERIERNGKPFNASRWIAVMERAGFTLSVAHDADGGLWVRVPDEGMTLANQKLNARLNIGDAKANVRAVVGVLSQRK